MFLPCYIRLFPKTLFSPLLLSDDGLLDPGGGEGGGGEPPGSRTQGSIRSVWGVPWGHGFHTSSFPSVGSLTPTRQELRNLSPQELVCAPDETRRHPPPPPLTLAQTSRASAMPVPRSPCSFFLLCFFCCFFRFLSFFLSFILLAFNESDNCNIFSTL